MGKKQAINHQGETLSHALGFDESCAEEIFNLYISAGIKRYKVRYCRSPTEEEVVRMWNGGFYKGYRKKSTLRYYNKYKEYKKALEK